jgi:hypothetical protein
MKSIKKIEQEMNNIQVEISTNSKEYTETAINRMKKRHSFLCVCKMYLESKPTDDFLEKEKERLSTRINLINAGYEPDQRLIDAGLKKEEQSEHKDYNKIMGLPKIKEQLKSIQFLLS